MGRTLRPGVPSRLRPVPAAPALLIEPKGSSGLRTLVVADLHLGLGGDRASPAGPPEGSADRLADELLQLVAKTRARRLIVAGDAKHPIVGVPPPLRPVIFRFFSRLLASGLEVELVPGNHDTGLVRHLPREVTVHSSEGLAVDGVGVFHGHRWPSEEVLGAHHLVAGHLHPGFRLAPTPEDPVGKQRCWVRVALEARDGIGSGPHRVHAREIVVLPAFNRLAGTEALNRERPARGRSFLFRRFLALGVPRAYLLDGTDLGVLPTFPEERETPRTPASGPARRGR